MSSNLIDRTRFAGVSPSPVKAVDSESTIRRFESYYPCQKLTEEADFFREVGLFCVLGPGDARPGGPARGAEPPPAFGISAFCSTCCARLRCASTGPRSMSPLSMRLTSVLESPRTCSISAKRHSGDSRKSASSCSSLSGLLVEPPAGRRFGSLTVRRLSSDSTAGFAGASP